MYFSGLPNVHPLHVRSNATLHSMLFRLKYVIYELPQLS